MIKETIIGLDNGIVLESHGDCSYVKVFDRYVKGLLWKDGTGEWRLWFMGENVKVGGGREDGEMYLCNLVVSRIMEAKDNFSEVLEVKTREKDFEEYECAGNSYMLMDTGDGWASVRLCGYNEYFESYKAAYGRMVFDLMEKDLEERIGFAVNTEEVESIVRGKDMIGGLFKFLSEGKNVRM